MTLKQQILSGVKWVALTNIFMQIISLVSTVIMARLLMPDDFGVFAILMIFVGFLSMFVGMGTSAAIVHLENPSEKLLSSIFYFNILFGFLLCMVLFVLSGPISVFFENPEIEELLKWLSLTFVIGSFTGVQSTLFSKKLEFKIPAIIGAIVTFISIIIGIIAAINGLGAYSLLLRALASSMLTALMIWTVSPWRPKFVFSMEELRTIFHFSTNLSGFSFINYFARNADNFLIGKFIGSTSLGMYNMAYSIMLYPLNNISHILIKVLFPAFSLIKDDNEKFKKGYLRVIFFIALISFPLMIGLMATSDILVSVVFGDKWHGLSTLLLILAPIGMMQSIVTTIGSIFMAKGNVKEMFKIGSINAIVTVLSFIIGIPFGVEGVALSYVVANIIMLYPNLHIAWRQIKLTVKEGLSEVFPIFMLSVIMGIVVVLLGEILEGSIENQIVRLIAMILSGVVIYLFLLKIQYGNLMLLVKELRNR